MWNNHYNLLHLSYVDKSYDLDQVKVLFRYTAATTMKHIYQLNSTHRLLILGFTGQKPKMAAIFSLAQISARFLSHFYVRLCDASFLFPLRTTWFDTRFLASNPCDIDITRDLSYVKSKLCTFTDTTELESLDSTHNICDYWLVLKLSYSKTIFSYFIVFVEFWTIFVSVCLLGLMQQIRTWTIS